MDQHAAALDMAEETVAEAGPLMGPLNQPGDVGQDEFAVAPAHDAELGGEGGEGVVRNLGLGPADGGQQGRFAGIGQADQPGIGDQLEAQPDPAFLAGKARAVLAGCPVGRGLEMGIAEAAIPAAAQHDALARLGQVEEQGLAVIVEDLGPHRHLEGQGLAAGAAAVLAHAVIAAAGAEMLLVAVVDQGVQIGHGLDDDVAAAPAMAAVRPAELDEFLAAEGDGPGPAVAALHIDLALIEKFHASARGRTPKEEGPG